MKQNEITTICIPQKHHQYLHKKLANAGFSPNMHYRFVSPNKIEKEHFNSVPSWAKDEALYKNEVARVNVDKAVQKIVAKHQ